MNIKYCSIVAIFAGTAALAEPSLERGEYLVEGPAGCGNCHTPIGEQGPVLEMNLAGRLVDETPEYTAIAPNITPAGRVAGWTDSEFARAIREGITPGGTRVIGPPMPIALYRRTTIQAKASTTCLCRLHTAQLSNPSPNLNKA